MITSNITLQKTKKGTAETEYASDISGCSSASTCKTWYRCKESETKVEKKRIWEWKVTL